MPSAGVKEKDFEATIERELLERGYGKGDPGDFDAERALIGKDLFAFLEDSQPALWEQLRKDHGSGLEDGVRDALEKNLKSRGTLDVLRHGFKYFGKRNDREDLPRPKLNQRSGGRPVGTRPNPHCPRHHWSVAQLPEENAS